MPEPRKMTLPALYNSLMGRMGYNFPKHFIPVAAALEDKRINKLLIILGPASGKSSLIDTVYPLFEIGEDNTTTVLLLSAGADLVNSFCRTAVEVIDGSPVFKTIYPGIRKNTNLGWSESRGYYIQRAAINNNPTLIAMGLDSSHLTGIHSKIIVMDDLHNAESSASQAACQRVIDLYYQQIVHRDVPEGSRFIGIGRRWSEFDIYGHLQDSGTFVTMVLPAERGEGVRNLWWDIHIPEGLECCFTEGMAEPQEPTEKDIEKGLRRYKAYYGVDPQEKGFYWPDFPAIRQRCMEIKRGSPDIFQAIFQCNPGAREGSVFLEKDFRYFSHKVPRLHPSNLPDLLKSGLIVQSWDFGQKTNKDSDYTVGLTCALIPCREWHKDESSDLLGNPDPHYDVYILDMVRDKLEIQDQLKVVREQAQIWHPSRILIEDKAAGIQIIQALQNSALPIQAVKANKSKRSRATEGIGGGPYSAQGWMRMGRTRIWAEAPWLEPFKTEMKNFTGDGSGHDDIVDSYVVATSYAISLGTGTPLLPTNLSETSLEKPTLAEIATIDPRAIALSNIEAIYEQRNFIDLPTICSTCRHKSASNLCSVHNRKVSGIDWCPHHQFPS